MPDQILYRLNNGATTTRATIIIIIIIITISRIQKCSKSYTTNYAGTIITLTNAI